MNITLIPIILDAFVASAVHKINLNHTKINLNHPSQGISKVSCSSLSLRLTETNGCRSTNEENDSSKNFMRFAQRTSVQPHLKASEAIHNHLRLVQQI